MDQILEQCHILRTLVFATTVCIADIEACAERLNHTMIHLVDAGSVPELVWARYKLMSNVDYVFEALCIAFFDKIFKTQVEKHQHAGKAFLLQLQPFINNCALKGTPASYLERFRIRRYSYQHRMTRVRRETQKAPVALLKPTLIEGVHYVRNNNTIIPIPIVSAAPLFNAAVGLLQLLGSRQL